MRLLLEPLHPELWRGEGMLWLEKGLTALKQAGLKHQGCGDFNPTHAAILFSCEPEVKEAMRVLAAVGVKATVG